MSVPPPGPSKKESNPNVTIALIGATATILAAAFPIISSITAKKEKDAPPAASSSAPSVAASIAAAPPPTTTTTGAYTDSQIPANALADKTSYTVTLNPYKSDPGAPDVYTAVGGAVFRSPKDHNKWVQLTIKQSQHNQIVELELNDSNRKEARTEFSADSTQTADSKKVETRNFKIVATVGDAKTGPDPAPTEKVKGNVFEKLVLNITCED